MCSSLVISSAKSRELVIYLCVSGLFGRANWSLISTSCNCRELAVAECSLS